MKIRNSILFIASLLLISSCNLFNRVEDAASGLIGADVLNRRVILPAGSFQIDDSQLIESSELSVSGTSSGVISVTPGSNTSTTINFNAQNGIDHVGIRFGTSGQTWMVPVSGGTGATSGSVDLPFNIPSDLCGDLSSICHDIKCYEFAARSNGSGSFNISRANINQLALLCGNCDEPSCQSLLGSSCTSSGGGVNAGACNGLDTEINNLISQYSSALSGGSATAACNYIRDLRNLVASDQYKQCVTQFGGLSISQWQDLVNQYDDLVALYC